MEKDYLGKVLSVLTVLMFFGVFAAVMTQIITRYMPISFTWTEELSRMLFVAAVCFCGPVAYRDHEFVIVDILIDQLPNGIRKYVELLIHIAIIILFVVILKFGITLTTNGHRQLMPTLGVPMSYAYGLIPFSAACFIYYAILNVVKTFKIITGKDIKEVN